jgi:two-component system OmpR family response regulator
MIPGGMVMTKEKEEAKPHILIVEDARDIREPLARYLREHSYRATMAADAVVARRVLKSSAIDLVVLDIMMPGEDGLSLCRFIRETYQTPVILLTARGEEVDRIIGLEMGADDYIPKPFSPRELIARIGAVIRRTNALPPRAQTPIAAKFYFGEWTLDTNRRELIGPDRVASPLSTGEYRLLLVLLERPKIALSRNQLLDLTKGRDAELFDRSIDNHVSRLRKKIEPDPKNPRYIKTVWGGGYIFAIEPRAEAAA